MIQKDKLKGLRSFQTQLLRRLQIQNPDLYDEMKGKLVKQSQLVEQNEQAGSRAGSPSQLGVRAPYLRDINERHGPLAYPSDISPILTWQLDLDHWETENERNIPAGPARRHFSHNITRETEDYPGGLNARAPRVSESSDKDKGDCPKRTYTPRYLYDLTTDRQRNNPCRRCVNDPVNFQADICAPWSQNFDGEEQQLLDGNNNTETEATATDNANENNVVFRESLEYITTDDGHLDGIPWKEFPSDRWAEPWMRPQIIDRTVLDEFITDIRRNMNTPRSRISSAAENDHRYYREEHSDDTTNYLGETFEAIGGHYTETAKDQEDSGSNMRSKLYQRCQNVKHNMEFTDLGREPPGSPKLYNMKQGVDILDATGYFKAGVGETEDLPQADAMFEDETLRFKSLLKRYKPKRIQSGYTNFTRITNIDIYNSSRLDATCRDICRTARRDRQDPARGRKNENLTTQIIANHPPQPTSFWLDQTFLTRTWATPLKNHLYIDGSGVQTLTRSAIQNTRPMYTNGGLDTGNVLLNGRVNSVHPKINSWNLTYLNKEIQRESFSAKGRNLLEPIKDPRKFGSIAHYQQIREENSNARARIQHAKSKLNTWQSPSTMKYLKPLRHNSQRQSAPSDQVTLS